MQRPDAYSVSSLTAYVSALFETDPRMQDVWVQGEISNFTAHRSGHWYFTLKDENSALKCVMWRSSTARIRMEPKHGDEVLVHGRLGVYEASGQYQLYADRMLPVGRGDLHQQFEYLKLKLQAEGLFDDALKQPLPVFPRRIGIVTSPTAAAFQDVQNVLRRRYPLAEVILSPSLVQGDTAPPEIVAALERLQQEHVDVILMVRGGGSLEDLWAFNDEGVARAVAACPIPVVSGVGHEIDFTIVDFVADYRAPTPSAAAEIATPNIEDIASALRNTRERLRSGALMQIDERRRMMEAQSRILRSLSPLHRIDTTRQRLDDLSARGSRAMLQSVTLLQERLKARHNALAAADPRTIMARGYAVVERDGARLTDARKTAPGDQVNIHLSRGSLLATVDETKDNHA